MVLEAGGTLIALGARADLDRAEQGIGRMR